MKHISWIWEASSEVHWIWWDAHTQYWWWAWYIWSWWWSYYNNKPKQWQTHIKNKITEEDIEKCFYNNQVWENTYTKSVNPYELELLLKRLIK